MEFGDALVAIATMKIGNILTTTIQKLSEDEISSEKYYVTKKTQCNNKLIILKNK